MGRRIAVAGSLVSVGLLLATVVVAHAESGDPQEPVGIVGGKPAAEGAFPWMARLSMGCGGSLISPDIILTAAHCFDSDSQNVTASIGKVRHVEGEKVSGNRARLGPGPEKGDWAVLKLNRPSSATAFAKLPVDASQDAAPTFRTIGWGATSEGGRGSDILMQVDVPLVPDNQCGEASEVEICAGDMAKGGIDSCQGDSGGPLLVRDVVVGLVSWGEGCARPGNPGHYAQVSAFLTEIKAAITQLGGQQPGGGGGPTPSPTGTPTDDPTADPTGTPTDPPGDGEPTGDPDDGDPDSDDPGDGGSGGDGPGGGSDDGPGGGGPGGDGPGGDGPGGDGPGGDGPGGDGPGGGGSGQDPDTDPAPVPLP